MTDDEAYLNAVKETLERLQIEPKDLFGYVFWLRKRYAACVEALHDIDRFSDDDGAAKLARETLRECGALEEVVSHETN